MPPLELLAPIAAFSLLTLALVSVVFFYRTLLVVTMRSRADVWPRSGPSADEPGLVQRAHDAHKNCVETLPLVMAAAWIGWVASESGGAQPSLVSSVLWAIVGLRIAQSFTHVLGVSHWHVFIRGGFFFGQICGLLLLLTQPWAVS